MLSLIRRKAPRNKREGRDSSSKVPDDILILIISLCRIDEFLTWRLTSSSIRNLIDHYTTSLVPEVARATFPKSELLLASFDKIERPTLQSLLGLIPQHLAAILIDRHVLDFHRTGRGHSVAAEDPSGNELRAHVANGFTVLHRLSQISKEVQRTSPDQSTKPRRNLTTNLFHPSRARLEDQQCIEDAILAARLHYITHLTPSAAEDYKITTTLLSTALSTFPRDTDPPRPPWIFEPTNGIDAQRAFRLGETWLTWFAMSEGLPPFWNQWWALPQPGAENYICNRALAVFQATPKALVNVQRAAGQKVQECLGELAQTRGGELASPYAYFRVDGTQGSERGWKETMGDVPFEVWFRCPEEVVEQRERVRRARGEGLGGGYESRGPGF